MSLPDIAPQTWYLYINKWDAKKDSLLLKCLIDKIDECKPSPPQLCPHALIYAMRSLNSQLQAGVNMQQVEGRVDFLHDRYVCFKHLQNLPETDWVAATNVVHADDEVWKRLFKENAFFRAYYHAGEPEYLKLCHLFGLYDVKTEKSHTVIVIEDSPQMTEKLGPQRVHDSLSDDEVASPQMTEKPPTNVNRELFPDDACSSVSPSFPISRAPHVYVPWPPIKNKLQFPPKNGFPGKPKFDEKSESGYGGSSCASSSPFK